MVLLNSIARTQKKSDTTGGQKQQKTVRLIHQLARPQHVIL